MDTAKVFMTGRSQAVRLPKAYRVEASEMTIEKVGDALVLRPLQNDSVERFLAERDAFLTGTADEAFPEREQPEWDDRDVARAFG
jgi:antitoxin VapB